VAPDKPGAKAWVVVVGALLVLGVLGGVLVATLRGQTTGVQAKPTGSLSPLVDAGTPVTPAVVTVTRSAKPGVVVATFTVTDPDPSDFYRVTRSDGGSGTHLTDEVATSPVTFTGVAAGDKVCVTVTRFSRGHRQAEQPTAECLK
jgi:hypothetical protein